MAIETFEDFLLVNREPMMKDKPKIFSALFIEAGN